MNIFKKIYHKFLKLKRWKQISIVISFILLIWYIFSLPRPLFDKPYCTLVEDRNGELLGAHISTDGQWRFPMPDSIPEKYRTCLIQFEDKHFKYHLGVDLLAIGRATLQNIKSKHVVSGGSTITMQTIRLMRRNNRTYFEKLIEMILATRLEISYSKNDILKMYAAHAPMGGNVVGIDAAAWRYFGHGTSNLSWAEAATLAVLPNSPSLMHFGRNRDKLLSKRNRLLKQLADKKIISESDYSLAVVEQLPLQPHELPQIAPHLVTEVYLKNPGKYVKSTIDKRLQLQADEVLSRWNDEFSQNGINNIAALIVDIQKNEVLVYIGNNDFNNKKNGNQVDIIQAPRSTGSVMKPFLYCAMLQDGDLLPKELVADVPININGFAPKNFSLQNDGAAPADEALARSLNIPAVLELKKYGIAKFYDFIKNMGMSTLNKPADYYGLSLILGGAEGTLWDIANGYSHLARTLNSYNKDQKYFEKKDFSYYTNNSARDDARIVSSVNPIFDAGAAWCTLEALTNVNRPEEIDWQFIPSMRKIAWKTGTSYGFRDAWAVGVTPRYLVAVWTGNASGEGRPGLTGARTSARVVFDLFNLLPNTSWFQTPYSDLREAEICRESGCLKGMNCPESSVDTMLVPVKGLTGDVCNYHKQVHLSLDGQYQVYEQCAGNRGIQTVSWFVLPPSQEWYYKQNHPSYRTLPPFSPECISGSSGAVMQFIYPYPNSVIHIAKQLDGSEGKVIFEIAHRNSSAKVYWHIDDQYLGETEIIHKIEAHPANGEHVLTAVDNLGNTIKIKFGVN